MEGGKGMEFAAALLSKFGWKEGQGLGRHQSGITEALRPKLKFDKAGVGHSVGDAFTNNWWEKAFNTAADNINVNRAKDGTVSLKTTSDFEITTQKMSSKQRKGLLFNNFMKVATLTNEGTMVEESPNDECESTAVPVIPTLTDEELFKACGSRTAHKGARHGLGLNGKLARIEEQERLLLLQYQNLTSNSVPTSKKRKSKKRSSLTLEDKDPLQIKMESDRQVVKNDSEMTPDGPNFKRKKKSKRKHGSSE